MSNYPLFAATSGSTIIDEFAWNGLLAMVDFENIRTGSVIDSKTGSGVNEVDCAGYSHCIRFTATAVTEIGRIELDLASDGSSADITIEIRTGMAPANGTDGTLLKSITIPGDWIPALQGYTSIPMVLTGMTAGNYYWIVIKKAGDSSNHFHLYGETSQDASYPCYSRSGSSGNWTIENSIHFKIFSGSTPGQTLLHTIQGGAILSYGYSAGLLSSIKMAVADINGNVKINQTMNLTRNGSAIIRGEEA